MKDVWDSGLEDNIKPIADKAIQQIANEFIDDPDIKDIETEIDGYCVAIIRNNAISENFFKMLYPHCKDATCMLNVEVDASLKYTNQVYTNIYYYIDGKWIHEKE